MWITRAKGILFTVKEPIRSNPLSLNSEEWSRLDISTEVGEYEKYIKGREGYSADPVDSLRHHSELSEIICARFRNKIYCMGNEQCCLTCVKILSCCTRSFRTPLGEANVLSRRSHPCNFSVKKSRQCYLMSSATLGDMGHPFMTSALRGG